MEKNENTPPPQQAIEVGDIVCLNGQSVSMTVINIEPDGMIQCQWFDKTKKLCQGAFPSASLLKVDLTSPSEEEEETE